MDIAGSVALITGADRGIGRAFVDALERRRAARIYAGAIDDAAFRTLQSLGGDRLVPVRLDVTDLSAVARVAEGAPDVTLLINNAGVLAFGGFLSQPSMAAARHELDVNYFGPLAMIRAFAPILAANGGGAIVNMLSIAARINAPFIASYSASKAAAASLTQGVRAELAKQGTLVVGVFPGPVNTDMIAGWETEKVPPRMIAEAALDAVEAGVEDVYPDPHSRELALRLARDPKALERSLARTVAR